MKKYYVNIILKMLADFFSLPLIIVLAYTFKFKIAWLINYFFNVEVGVIYHHAQIEPYLKHILVMSSSMVGIFFIFGAYKKHDGVMYRVDEMFAVIKSLSIALAVLLLGSILYDFFPDSRGVMVNGWLIAIFIMFFTRKGIDSITDNLFVNYDYSVVMIGSSQKLQVLLEALYQARKKINYLGTYTNEVPAEMILFYKNKFVNLGTITAGILAELKSKKVDIVYVDPAVYNNEDLRKLVLFCEKENIVIHIVQNNNLTIHGAVKIEEFAGVTLVSYPTFYFSRTTRVVKRIFDLIGSVIGLLILAPIFLLISIWIKLVSFNGPVFYKQERVGKFDKSFNMLKFRTMIPDAEAVSGPTWVSDSDDRYIKGGKWLRKYSLDELPQLINIFTGKMSIIGPRPERPFFVDKITKDLPQFNLRHSVKGGLTGWAQIHGRSYMTNKPSQKLAYDLYYITNWSFTLDIKIVIKTLFVVTKGEQAY